VLTRQRIGNPIIDSWAPLARLGDAAISQQRSDVTSQSQVSGLFGVRFWFKVGLVDPSQGACVVTHDEKAIVVVPLAFFQHADKLGHAC
jgi:hypothetical protein